MQVGGKQCSITKTKCHEGFLLVDTRIPEIRMGTAIEDSLRRLEIYMLILVSCA